MSRLGEKEFRHEVNSVVVAQRIERKGTGLKLTYETLEGLLLHSRGGRNMRGAVDSIEEYNAVMYADKISYVL